MDLSETLGRMFSWWFPGLFAIMGLGLVVLTLHLARRAIILSTGQDATGRIVDWKHKTNDEGPVSYVPVFRFTPSGSSDEIEVTSQNAFRTEPGAVDQAVMVRYDPAKPHRAEIAGQGRQWLAVLVVLLLGCGTFYLSWYLGSIS